MTSDFVRSPNQPRGCTDALPFQMSRTRISEWGFREDRACGRLIPEEISATEHETDDCQREGAYGDFVPTASKWGDKNIRVRRMKVATRYRSGKADGELLIAAGAGDRHALEEIPGVQIREGANGTHIVLLRSPTGRPDTRGAP
jgi:hypothetical protein